MTMVLTCLDFSPNKISLTRYHKELNQVDALVESHGISDKINNQRKILSIKLTASKLVAKIKNIMKIIVKTLKIFC